MWDWDLQTDEVFFSERWKEMLGFADLELPNHLDEWRQRIHPDDASRAKAAIEAYLVGRTPNYELKHRLRHKDGSYRWIYARGAALRDEAGQPRRFAASHTDITDQRGAEVDLAEQRRMLATLLGNLPGMAYRCRITPEWPMEFVSEGCFALTGYTSEALIAEPAGYTNLIHPEDRDMVWKAVQAALDSGESFRLTYRIITAGGDAKWVWEQGCRVYSIDEKPDVLEGFITDVTDRVLAYQTLEQRVADQTRELSLLLDVSHDVAGSLELGPLAGLILERIKGVVDYTGGAIFLLDEDGDGLNLLRYQGPIPQHTIAWRWTLTTHDHAREVVRTGKPVIIPDVFADTRLANAFRRNAALDIGEVRSDFGAWIGVPMVVGDRVIGIVAVEIDSAGHYTERDAQLLSAIAGQAAVAVENARLFVEARGFAAIEERQKLARELHDSVSQALYGITLGTRTARTLLDRDPALVAEPLDYVLSLAEAGMAEMRSLIFQLRPEALAEEGLVAALEKQATALRVRYGLTVLTDFGEEPDTPFEVKEALYRIAQEALHNVVKHSRADQVAIRLAMRESGILLEVEDNGIGFDPDESFPGHLGLRSMRERAARQAGTIDITTAPGEGVTTRVIVPPSR